jgi:predicted branched-subunit amino acid permease
VQEQLSPVEDPRARLSDGLRAGVPFALAGGVVAISFGVVARQAGLSPVAAVVMSAIVYAGSAQFAAIAILAQGGGVGAAVAAAALMNSRFLPMGVALAPSLPGRAAKRAAQGQTVVDASWVLAARQDGTFDRWILFGSSAVQYVTWVGGTALGRSAATCSATRPRSASTRCTRRSSSRCSSTRCAAGAGARRRPPARWWRSCWCRWRRRACPCCWRAPAR